MQPCDNLPASCGGAWPRRPGPRAILTTADRFHKSVYANVKVQLRSEGASHPQPAVGNPQNWAPGLGVYTCAWRHAQRQSTQAADWKSNKVQISRKFQN